MQMYRYHNQQMILSKDERCASVGRHSVGDIRLTHLNVTSLKK